MASVLVIDDAPGMRRLMARILTTMGHVAIEAEDGAVGLKLFKEYRPPLVITDVLMPERDGIETILSIRRLSLATKILAVSGGGQSFRYEFLEVTRKFGAQMTLRKPFRTDEFVAAVTSLLPLDP